MTGSKIDSESFEAHRLLSQLEDTKERLQVLKATVECRTPPDKVLDDAVSAVEVELSMLGSYIKRLIG